MTSRPWSKYSKGSSAYLRKHPEEAKEKKGLGKSGKGVSKGAEGEEMDEEAKREEEEERKKKGRFG